MASHSGADCARTCDDDEAVNRKEVMCRVEGCIGLHGKVWRKTCSELADLFIEGNDLGVMALFLDLLEVVHDQANEIGKSMA